MEKALPGLCAHHLPLLLLALLPLQLPLQHLFLLLLLLLLLLAQEGQKSIGRGEFPSVASRGDAFAPGQCETATDLAPALCDVRFGPTVNKCKAKSIAENGKKYWNLWEMSFNDCGELSFCFPESLSPRRCKTRIVNLMRLFSHHDYYKSQILNISNPEVDQQYHHCRVITTAGTWKLSICW